MSFLEQQEHAEAILFSNVKSTHVNSASLCCFGIMQCALSRGLHVEVYSEPEVRSICSAHGVQFRGHYHRIGHVFSISDGQKKIILNKTKFLTSRLPSEFSKKSLKKTGHLDIQTPKGFFFTKSDFNFDHIERQCIRFPVVLKPANGSMGKGVYLDIESFDELEKLVNESESEHLIIEEQIKGDEYRIYLIEGRYYGAVKRIAPHVVGDGKHSIKELIDQKNKYKKKLHHPAINIDTAQQYISKAGLEPSDVPSQGTVVKLSGVLGRSSGGDIRDVTAELPLFMQEKINSIGSFFSKNLCIGLDVIVRNNYLYVIEVNDRPQLSSLLTPDQGAGKNIADDIVKLLFPSASLSAPVYNKADEIRSSVNSVKKNSQTLTIVPGYAVKMNAANEVNDLTYKELKSPVNANRLVLWREAHARGLQVCVWANDKGHQRWSITSARRAIVFRENMPSCTSSATRRLTNDKELTKAVLQKSGISVPDGIRIVSSDIAAAKKWYDSLGPSPLVVVKPLSGAGGRGVVSNISSSKSMLQALSALNHESTLLEEHIHGHDYRLFVVGGRFKYSIKRVPAYIVGDGVSDIKTLVEHKNRIRVNNPYTGRYPLKLDNATLKRLSRKGLSDRSILNSGERVYLQDIANIGVGGDSEDVTDKVHPDFIEISERVYACFQNLAFCGLDIIAEDISKPVSLQRYAVIEVNANCDLAMHHFPTKGVARNAAGDVISALFPESFLVSSVSRTFLIEGKVQGVGFRKWFKRQAILRSVVGNIANIPDGSVFALVQGSASALEDLAKVAAQGPSKSIVERIVIQDSEFVKNIANFTLLS